MHFTRCVSKSLFPRDLLPGQINRAPYHWRAHAFRVIVIVKGKAAFDATMSVVRFALFPGDHAHHFPIAGLGFEAAAHAAVRASSDNAVVRFKWYGHEGTHH